MSKERESELLYNHYVKQIEGLIGKEATSTEQLDDLGFRLFGEKYRGTFPRDYVDNKLLSAKRPYAIINNQTSSEPGEHWVALAYKNGKYFAYDSYGNHIFSLIPELKKLNNKVINSDLDQEQKYNQNNCGARSMSWLYMFDKHGKEKALLI